MTLSILALMADVSGNNLLPWLKVLAVPFTIGAVVPVLNWLQKNRELAVERQREEDAALQAYLDKMSELLIDEHLHEKDDPYDETRVTARARTLAVLGRLDEERKRTVLLFLREARLINRWELVDCRGHVIYHAHYVGLEDADLRKANLKGARLISTSGEEPVYLKGAILEGANLSWANLSGADLTDANLTGADLTNADLTKADLSGAYNKPKDSFDKQIIPSEELERQTKLLKGATMPDGSEYP